MSALVGAYQLSRDQGVRTHSVNTDDHINLASGNEKRGVRRGGTGEASVEELELSLVGVEVLGRAKAVEGVRVRADVELLVTGRSRPGEQMGKT